MNQPSPTRNIPPKLTIGLDWDRPYNVRYSSNLDDGPCHGLPLEVLAAAVLTDRLEETLTSGIWGEQSFGNLPACQFNIFEETNGRSSKLDKVEYHRGQFFD